MKGRKQKISEDNYLQNDRAELDSNEGVQTFLWMTESGNTGEILLQQSITLNLKNRRVPNGMHGGVRGRNGK
jgi:hypothetical protein